jgi:TolA-binding protein
MPGAYKTKAMFLYGDALYRQGAFKRAKDIFIGLHKKLAGDEKATAQRKVAACNRALKLPESDGVVAPQP